MSPITLSAYAEVIPDQSLGAESSRVNTETNSVNIDTIRIEEGAVRGSNVFHSFSQFDVNTNQRVFFAPASNITNIFSRVTGSSASTIDGTLGVIGNANLFLLNPQGVVFGPNATLDLNGSFLATTADSFDWGNGLSFSAVNPNPAPSLLNVGIKPGLQYGSGNSGSLVSEANLETKGPVELASQTLDLRGSLTTEASDVTLRGADVTLTDMELFTRLDEDQVGKAGNVRIEGDRITVNGPSYISTEAFGQGDGGKIEVVASESILLQSLVPDGGNAFQLRQRFDSSVHDAGNAGEIRLTAPTVTLDNADLLSELERDAIGSAGDVLIDADTITMDTFADIETQSFGQGNGGDITLQAGTIDILGTTELTTRLQSDGVGKAGNIRLQAERITLQNKSKLRTESFSQGNGGDVALVGTDIKLLGESEITTRLKDDAEGNAGDVLVEAQRFEMRGGSRIQTETTGKGNSGNVTLNVPGEIFMEGNSEIDVRNAEQRPQNNFRIFRGDGDSGRIIVNGGKMTLINAPLWAQVLGKGKGRGITVNLTGDLLIDGQRIQETDAEGKTTKRNGSSGFFTDARQTAVSAKGEGAGDLTVSAPNITMIGSQARIQAGTIGNSFGGNAIVTVSDKLSLSDNARILSSADAGAKRNAGDITIKAKRIELLKRGIFESATRSNVDAGDITITTDELLMDDQGQIVASTTEKGNAGDITINASRSIDILKDSVILSGVITGKGGDGGNIDITTGALRLRQGGRIEAQTEAKLPNLVADSLREQLKEGSYGDIIQESTPVAYWRLDETNGNAADSGSSGRFNGIEEGGPVGSSTDAIAGGQSAQFDGNGPGGVIRVDSDIELEKTTFILEAWIKPDQENTPRQSVVFSAIDETSTRRDGFRLITYKNEATNTQLDSGGIYVADSLPVDGQWHHVVNKIKYDKNTGGVKITNYLNGQQVQGGAGGSLRLDEETVRIGGYKGPDSQPFKGLVDEVAIYKSESIPVDEHYIAGRLSLDPSFEPEVSGKAIAGNINITANTIDIAGVSDRALEEIDTRGEFFRGISSGIFSGSESEFSGQGGNIDLNVAESLNIDDAGVVSALTNSLSKAGKVNINADVVNLTGGGQILATSSRTGEAGDIQVAAKRISIAGSDPNYQARLQSVRDNGEKTETRIDVNGAQSGIITSNLNGTGGDILLQPSELLTLRDGGLIRTDSGEDGGNIKIDNQTGFIVSVADQNSDISANAGKNGGDIDIVTQGVFGIQFREQPTALSDITATGEFTNGTVDVDVLNIDPTRSLTELPTTVTDPSNQISRSCSSQSVSQSSFTQTGRGGLPAGPDNPLRSSGNHHGGTSPWIALEQVNGSSTAAIASPSPQSLAYSSDIQAQENKAETDTISEAKSWTTSSTGEVQLISAGSITPNHSNCNNAAHS